MFPFTQQVPLLFKQIFNQQGHQKATKGARFPKRTSARIFLGRASYQAIVALILPFFLGILALRIFNRSILAGKTLWSDLTPREQGEAYIKVVSGIGFLVSVTTTSTRSPFLPSAYHVLIILLRLQTCLIVQISYGTISRATM